MADIMMCEADCPVATKCRRSAQSGTQVNPWRQSYWMRKDDDPVGESCPNYWEKVG